MTCIYKRVIPCRNMFKTFCFHICKLKANGTPNSEKKWPEMESRNGRCNTYIDCGQMAGISSRPPFLTNVITSLFCRPG